MNAPGEAVFLLDCDNTLLDNDRVLDDFRAQLAHELGAECRDRYWKILENLHAELGYMDYLGALQRCRLGALSDPRLLRMSEFLLDYPFAQRLYPLALQVIELFRRRGTTVILSDGDVVFQPRKIRRSGLWQAVEGHVLVCIHKERVLAEIEDRYPAARYVMVDDKLHILAQMKKAWGDRLTTVFVRQGQYAQDLRILSDCAPADFAVDRIGDLLNGELPASPRPSGARLRGEKDRLKPAQRLHNLGQSLWLDNIRRDLLTSGTLARYMRELAVTGLTSNPTIFDHAINDSTSYDAAIRTKANEGKSGEDLFFELALEDLVQAADLFRPIHEATGGVDGWVSLEISPLLADDTGGSIKAAARLHARAQRPNLFIKIPGTEAGIAAIEESIFAGIPVNVTLLFSREHYLAAAEAYMRGIERRLALGLGTKVASVASVFVSRWDVAVRHKVSAQYRNRLGIAVAMHTHKAYRDLLASRRWRNLAAAGAMPQRLLWASTGTKDPAASDVLYVEALAAPETINTLPEKTLKAYAEHGEVHQVLPAGEGYADTVLAEFAREGIDLEALAAQLQREGVAAFAKSWHELMYRIAEKTEALSRSARA